MARAKQLLTAIVFGALVGCAPPTAPGMAVVATSASASGPGSMLVAFPTTPCTGNDSAVFLDDKGAFVAAVAPGTATYVAFPEEATRLYVFSSHDINAEPRTWFSRRVVVRPPERVEQGLVVEVARRDAKNCYRFAPPNPLVVSYDDATRAAKDLRWLDVRPGEGAQWVGEHRARVTELITQKPHPP